MSESKRSPDDPRYRIPGTNFINLSHWSRENEPKSQPKYKVGDVVVVTLTCEITSVGNDCDGTVLYGLDSVGFGYNEDCLRPATEDELKNF